MPEGDLEEVVVSGRRAAGSVISDIPPEATLSSQEIRALGVGSVTELIAALGPQLGSSGGRGGRPVVLINGVRVSGFAEVRDLPTEAIQRVDIFPEEVALRYGYRADQRVMNIVLRPRFRAVTADIGARGSTEGGREGSNVGAGLLRVQRDTRWQVDLKARHDDRLLESEREVVGADGVPRPDAASRTLLPATDQWSANLVYARPLGEGFAATVNATFDDTRRRSLLGLRPSIDGDAVLRRDVESRDAHLGGLLQGSNAGWRWSATLNADRTDATTRVAGGDLAGRTRSDSLDLELLATGTPLQLPAGDLGLTVKGGLGTRGVESIARRITGDVRSDLSRGQRDLRLNLDLPLLDVDLSQGNGRLTMSLGHAIEDVADVGTLSTTNLGLNGSLGRKWRALVSLSEEENPPSMQQLGAAVIPTPAVRTYDFVRGEAVEIVRIDGGNAALTPDSRRILKFALGARPIDGVDLDLNAEYTHSRARDVITPLSYATPELEQAFPERFLRDPAGRLLSIDARPVNFSGRDRDELRFTLNLSRPWGPQPEMPSRPSRGAASAREGGDGAAARPPVDPAAMAARFLSFARRGSAQFSLVYTHRLKDEVRIAPGLSVLDLLDGDTLSDTEGSPQHEFELQGGANRDGWGGRMVVRWRDGSRLRGGASASGPVDLAFEPLTTVDLRLFADLGLQPWARDNTALRGVRVTFAIENLLDDHPQVRAADGTVPLNYQPSLLDPQGRAVRLSFRKLFFPSFTPPARVPR
jgi:iron complex outermembrane receptor protein